MPGEVLNIAAYRFVPMRRLTDLRVELQHRAEALALRGTVLLAPEGINLFLAGEPGAVRQWLAGVRLLPGLADLEVKESYSNRIPFGRLRVRIKREIIAFRRTGVSPGEYTSPRVSPEQLKAWLDDGKPVVLLDTRNDYETELGSFEQAITLPLDDFVNLPEHLAGHLDRLPPKDSDVPIVTFCTGGIRCEKAAPYLESIGYRNVLQLDGGILNYFQRVGSAHYRGACWVFDDRRALTPDLAPIEG